MDLVYSEGTITLVVDEVGVILNMTEDIISMVLGCDGLPSVGETFRITATITDLNGNPVTAGANSIDLFEPDGSLNQNSVGPTHVAGGVWTQNFTTLTTDPVGGYLVVWTIIAGGVTGIGKIKVFIDDPPV